MKVILKPKGFSVVRKKQVVNSPEELRRIIDKSAIDANLNYLDVSGLDNLSYLFKGSYFNGDISEWDVSNVLYMDGTFYDSDFNGDISKWDVSKVISNRNIFHESALLRNHKLPKWYNK